MKRGFLLLFLVFLVSSVAPTVFAQTSPQVSNLTATPSTINTDTLLSLSWTLSNATGYSIFFVCPSGVTVFNDLGVSVACNTRVAVSSAGSGSTGYSFVNVSGTGQRVSITMYPKDSSGQDSDAGSMTTSVYVNSVVNPISDFTSSSLTPQSGVPFTLTWVSHHITGVNIKIDCTSDVTITPLSTTPFVCGAMLSAASLSASGSQPITATNKSLFASPISITILPVIASGSYDGLNAKALSLSIGGALPPKEASAVSFTSASSTVSSNATSTFSWITANTAGANIQIACVDDVFVYDASGVIVPCGRPAFSSAIGTGSTTEVRMVNRGTARKLVRVSLLLQRADSTYVVAPGRDLSILLLVAGETGFIAQSTTNLSTTTSPAVTTATGSLTQKSSTTLTLTLRKGMRHSQVSVLQTFLALDSTIYPEGSVTGLFGPATFLAVKRFQKRYGIADEKSGAYGLVGPATRAKINSLKKP